MQGTNGGGDDDMELGPIASFSANGRAKSLMQTVFTRKHKHFQQEQITHLRECFCPMSDS